MKRTAKPTRIDRLLAELLRQKKWRQGLLAARVREHWPEMVGPEIAAHTQPAALHGSRLEVRCDHDVWRAELMFLRPEILARLRESLGDDTIQEIWLK